MDCNPLEHNFDYILEKWEKYIGTKPKENENLDWSVLSALDRINFDDNRDFLIKWRYKWGLSNYTKIKEILYFISIINKKGLYLHTPSGIIDIYTKLIGDPNLINKYEYKHLHVLVEESFNRWKDTLVNNREFKLIILENENSEIF
jgi:hypothetical protein